MKAPPLLFQAMSWLQLKGTKMTILCSEQVNRYLCVIRLHSRLYNLHYITHNVNMGTLFGPTPKVDSFRT